MPETGGGGGLHGTLKNIAIFLLFLAAMCLWADARGGLERMLPRIERSALSLFLWTTGVVAIFHLLYHYLGKLTPKMVYLIAAAGVLGTLLYYGQIRL